MRLMGVAVESHFGRACQTPNRLWDGQTPTCWHWEMSDDTTVGCGGQDEGTL